MLARDLETLGWTGLLVPARPVVTQASTLEIPHEEFLCFITVALLASVKIDDKEVQTFFSFSEGIESGCVRCHADRSPPCLPVQRFIRESSELQIKLKERWCSELQNPCLFLQPWPRVPCLPICICLGWLILAVQLGSWDCNSLTRD